MQRKNIRIVEMHIYHIACKKSHIFQTLRKKKLPSQVIITINKQIGQNNKALISNSK